VAKKDYSHAGVLHKIGYEPRSIFHFTPDGTSTERVGYFPNWTGETCVVLNHHDYTIITFVEDGDDWEYQEVFKEVSKAFAECLDELTIKEGW
jgi:hypothetical protein